MMEPKTDPLNKCTSSWQLIKPSLVLKLQGPGAVASDLQPSAGSLPPNVGQGIRAKAPHYLGLQRTPSNYCHRRNSGRSSADR